MSSILLGPHVTETDATLLLTTPMVCQKVESTHVDVDMQVLGRHQTQWRLWLSGGMGAQGNQQRYMHNKLITIPNCQCLTELEVGIEDMVSPEQVSPNRPARHLLGLCLANQLATMLAIPHHFRALIPNQVMNCQACLFAFSSISTIEGQHSYHYNCIT
jgi:hypothetical protein